LLLRRFFVYIFIGNDLEALYRLGTVYGAPIGNTKYDKYNDMGRAAQCYRIAAERGHPLACRAWGKFLFKGIGGCSINPGKAWKWYLKASKCGKYSKRRRSNVAVIIVKVIFISLFLFYCLLLNHSFPTNPNRITNCLKLILFLYYNFTNYICSMLSRYFDF